MTDIRPATADDAAMIRRMVRAEGLDPTSLVWSHFLIAEEAGQIVGIGQIRPHNGANELGSLIVLPDYRGRGIGKDLVRALEAKAGFPLYLFTAARTVTYYEKLGYRVIGYRDVPPGLKVKALFPLALRLVGLRVVVMRKDG